MSVMGRAQLGGLILCPDIKLNSSYNFNEVVLQMSSRFRCRSKKHVQEYSTASATFAPDKAKPEWASISNDWPCFLVRCHFEQDPWLRDLTAWEIASASLENPWNGMGKYWHEQFLCFSRTKHYFLSFSLLFASPSLLAFYTAEFWQLGGGLSSKGEVTGKHSSKHVGLGTVGQSHSKKHTFFPLKTNQS
jgi:hypothetical protein